ncbi:histidine kinase [Evansella tamaricis]|uniref:Histidine kinase n=1 Tax=Evansella tamaricis TaxID=2069301 RepID=A0ABS6JD68_9BACI|nr:histidine kinase [Evansella tamaricis]MBU9711613.1 histidine kinase [Evansella tamaricis]
MKHLIGRLHRNLNISTKLFIMTFVMINVLILSVSFLYSNNAREVLLQEQLDYAQQFTSKTDEYLTLNLNNIHGFLLSVANDSFLQTGDYNHLQGWFREYLALYIPNAKNVHLLDGDKVVASSSHVGWLLDGDEGFHSAVMRLAVQDQIHWSEPYYSPVSGQTVTAVIQLRNVDGKNLVLALDIDLPQLYENIFPNTLANMSGKLVLLDYHNHPLFGSDPYVEYDPFRKEYDLALIDPALFNASWQTTIEELNGNDHLFVRSQSNPLLWQVVWILDKNEIFRSLQEGMDYYTILTIISLCLAIVISFILSRTIGHPIQILAKSMDHVGQGNWETKIELDRNDELGKLGKHFNSMTDKINDLVTTLQKTEQAKKEADFTALQSQIRPHFIFNTLNSISIAAREKNHAKVDQLITAFSETIHYSLESAPSLVTLDDEIHALKNYMSLMQIRYDYKFDFDLDIDVRSLGFQLPKFSLQPLVENAIFHGLVPAKNGGMLFIGTELGDDSWDIIIEDNGIGMDAGKLADLHNTLRKMDADLAVMGNSWNGPLDLGKAEDDLGMADDDLGKAVDDLRMAEDDLGIAVDYLGMASFELGIGAFESGVGGKMDFETIGDALESGANIESATVDSITDSVTDSVTSGAANESGGNRRNNVHDEVAATLPHSQSDGSSRRFDSGHIGMKNVHGRLKLLFGDAYHVRIKSNIDEGTRIILTIPIQKEETFS